MKAKPDPKAQSYYPVWPKNVYPRRENSACANVTVFPIPLILAVDEVAPQIIISLVCHTILISLIKISLLPQCKQELRSQNSNVSIINSPC